jgi:hypothetical protein
MQPTEDTFTDRAGAAVEWGKELRHYDLAQRMLGVNSTRAWAADHL